MRSFLNFLLKRKKYIKGVVNHWPVLFKTKNMYFPEVSMVVVPDEDYGRLFFKGSFIRLCKECPPIQIEFDEKDVLERLEKKEKADDEHKKQTENFFEEMKRHLLEGEDND